MGYDTLLWRWAAAASMAPGQPQGHEGEQHTLTTILYPYEDAVVHFQYSLQ